LGAHQYDFDLETGISDLSPKPGQALDLDALRATVEDAGFELLELELDVTGDASATDPKSATEATLTVPSTGQVFHLVLGEASANRMAWSTLMERLESGHPSVRVSGPAEKGEATSIELEVHLVEPAVE